MNQYYFYGVDRDFGPFFLKFCSYFPYTARLCLNGHEYLDNGILWCEEPQRLQALADDLSGERIAALLEKWLERLPHPFTAQDRAAGYRYELSILQAEFALTQVLDRPRTGRIFFEEVIRENLDVGRPSQVGLVFARRVSRRTPGRFRTRVITEGVTPTLYIDYKSSRMKQYHKEGRALRTETTINNPQDFTIGKRLKNLPRLREVGFQANRRLLDVQRLSHDCRMGEEAFRRLTTPREVEGQRVSALRFDSERVQLLLNALVLFRLLPRGFANRELREQLARLMGLKADQLPRGRMTYELRRLRLHGLIERIPRTHRYRVTELGLRTALFWSRAYARILRPGLTRLGPEHPELPTSTLRTAFTRLAKVMEDFCDRARLAA